MLSRVVLLALLVVVLTAAGCGGGSSDSATDTEPAAPETTGTTTGTGSGPTGESGVGESDGSFSPDSKVCVEVTNQGSALNIAASTGDFATVAARWKTLGPEFPPDLQDEVKTIVEGYEQVAADPNAFDVMTKPPYSTSLEAVNTYTAAECAN